MYFTMLLTGNVIDVTHTFVRTPFLSDYGTDPLARSCSGNISVALFGSGGSFTPDGLYDASWTMSHFRYHNGQATVRSVTTHSSSDDGTVLAVDCGVTAV